MSSTRPADTLENLIARSPTLSFCISVECESFSAIIFLQSSIIIMFIKKSTINEIIFINIDKDLHQELMRRSVHPRLPLKFYQTHCLLHPATALLRDGFCEKFPCAPVCRQDPSASLDRYFAKNPERQKRGSAPLKFRPHMYNEIIFIL